MCRKISELQSRLEWLESQPANPDTIHALRNTRVGINCWLEKEDEMWRQRSRLNWFREGDRNTSFFHAKALARYTKNYIKGLFDGMGIGKKMKPRLKRWWWIFTASFSL